MSEAIARSVTPTFAARSARARRHPDLDTRILAALFLNADDKRPGRLPAHVVRRALVEFSMQWPYRSLYGSPVAPLLDSFEPANDGGRR
jgi:hypothetical protein